MRRLPYYVRYTVILKSGEVCPRIFYVPPDQLEYRMSKALSEFIIGNSICIRCQQRISDFEKHIACTKSEFQFSDVEPILPASLQKPFGELLKNEAQRIKAYNRIQQLKKAGGTHNREQLMKLRGYQEDRCYYCFESLISIEGRFIANRDHFLAVAKGGGNEISNIVYACRKCNVDKGACDGKKFRSAMARRASPEVKIGLRRIQRTVSEGEF